MAYSGMHAFLYSRYASRADGDEINVVGSILPDVIDSNGNNNHSPRPFHNLKLATDFYSFVTDIDEFREISYLPEGIIHHIGVDRYTHEGMYSTVLYKEIFGYLNRIRDRKITERDRIFIGDPNDINEITEQLRTIPDNRMKPLAHVVYEMFLDDIVCDMAHKYGQDIDSMIQNSARALQEKPDGLSNHGEMVVDMLCEFYGNIPGFDKGLVRELYEKNQLMGRSLDYRNSLYDNLGVKDFVLSILTNDHQTDGIEFYQTQIKEIGRNTANFMEKLAL